MLLNYIKTALRNLVKHKAYSFINITGLGIGMACFLLIMLWVKNEASYDGFHEHGDNIYRVSNYVKFSDREFDTAIYVAAMGQSLREEFPEIDDVVRFRSPISANFKVDEISSMETQIIHVDSELFDVFSFKLLQGNPKTALEAPNSIVLTETMARKYFGEKSPLGKVIRMDNKDDLTVTGVVEDSPDNSHIQFSAFISFISLYSDPNMYMDWNGGHQYLTFIKINENTSPYELEQKFPAFIEKHTSDFLSGSDVHYRLHLQPLQDIYLYINNNIQSVYIFSAIALVILLIACMNFMNLTTARSINRAREVGIRKSIGADKISLIMQFLGESVILSFAGLIIALILIELLLPAYNNVLRKNLSFYNTLDWKLFAGIPFLVLIVGIISGSYPAFYLSAFNPSKVLKGNVKTGKERSGLRNSLVIVQFVVSIALIIFTITIYNQLQYVQNKDLGFDTGSIVVIPLFSNEAGKNIEQLKTAYSAIPEVISSGASSQYPGAGYTMNGYVPEDMEKPILFHFLAADYEYLEMMGIEIIQGRNFSRDFASDKGAFIINESLLTKMGWDNPIGKKISRNGDHEVIGVVRDFHFSPLQYEIAPLIIDLRPWRLYSYVSVKINNSNIPETIGNLEKIWYEINPADNFEYFFLDETIDAIYGSDRRFGKIFIYFTTLAIAIACLGLLGLASFASEQRTKEIGIRKVLGATDSNIILMLSQEFLKLVLFANIVAWPIAYYIMNRWLQEFAYKVNIGVFTFLLSGAAALIIAIFTISFQAIKAARSNPANVLKYE